MDPRYGDPQFGGPQFGGPQFGPPPHQPPPTGPQAGHGVPSPGATPPTADGAPAATTTPRRPSPVILAAAAVIAVIAVILLVTAFWVPGFAVTEQLSRSAAETGVRTVLERDYQAVGVSDVRCPDGQEVSRGASFRCTLTVAGAQQVVTVTFVDDDGTYEVGRPTSN